VLHWKCASDFSRASSDGSRLLAKLKVGGIDDPLEHEADAVADRVLRLPHGQVATPPAPLQVNRKCSACKDEEEKIQTKRAPGINEEADQDVDGAIRVAQRGGAPLPESVRSFFEPRFGHDFSKVRVHADGESAIAAHAIRARAYTVGRNIVFGSGEYAPGTETGKRLLAHELAHVVQTRAGMPAQVARKGDIDLEVDPDCPPGFMCFDILNGNKAHQQLTQQDKDAITAKAGGSATPGQGLSTSKDGPRFVLHDTATSFGPPRKEAQHLAELKSQDSTPVGEGPAAYVTAAGAPERTHTKFYNAQRPTATEFERGNDLLKLPGRESAMQQVWALTDPAAQATAVSGFLALFPNLSAQDVARETTKALKNLDPTQTTPATKASGKTTIMTTASGAVSQICAIVAAGGAATVAVKGQETALTAACAVLNPVFNARKTRVAESTNIEIIADKGGDCDESSATPFSGYVPAVYDAVAKLYVLAALEAGQFPEVTTHYFLDSTTPAGSQGPVTDRQNRCDPRCFNLDLLYAKIAAILNHSAGSTYGIQPTYGTKFGTSNVWWPPKICGGPPPGSAAAPSTTPPAKNPASTKKKKK
jgi:hypothetical protein